MTLGERICDLRKQKGYSQEYIAHELDISRQAVYKWENDLSNPDTAHLIKLAEILAVSVEYLATGKQENLIIDNQYERKPKKRFKKRSKYFKISVSIISIVLGFVISFITFIGTRSVSFDAVACSGGFKTHIWNEYKDTLFEKYKSGFNDNCTREVIEDSRDVIFKDKTIVFFFDVAVTDENGNNWTDYVHVKGKRIWIEKYVLGNCIISEKISPENYFGTGYDGD